MGALRIGIDGYNLALPHGTGVATYGRVLAHTLQGGGHCVEGVFGVGAGRSPDAREARFIDYFVNRGGAMSAAWRMRLRARAALPWGGVAGHDIPLTGMIQAHPATRHLPSFSRLVAVGALFELAHRHFRHHRRFIRLRIADPPTIMHWTYPVPIILAGARNVYTLHDLVPLRLPYTTLDDKAIYADLVRRCVLEAAHICTVSEASRNDILELLPAKSEQVTNAGQIALVPPPESNPSFGKNPLGLPPQSYFLFFGAIEPKKNIGRMIEAYLATGTTTPLVLVGGTGWQSEGELALLSESVPSANQRMGRVIRVDYLPHDALSEVIRCARAVLFPSLYEGFGLPVLEALQLGVPVLTSRTSSLPEVGGDAAIYVDPYDVASLAAGILVLDREPELRERLSQRALARSTQFSSEQYLARLEDMYGRILAPIAVPIPACQ